MILCGSAIAWVNPVVRLTLRSPMHPLLSRSLVILSYRGRKTGRWRSLPCMYARNGQELFIIPGQPDRKVWWRNLRRPSPVRLRLRGRDLEGTATASTDPEAIAAGLHRYLARYPKAAKALGVRLDANGASYGTALGAHPLVVVTVHLDRS